MSIRVNDFKYIPGENDAEYIKLLKRALTRQQQITSNAIAKIKAMIKSGQIWTPVSEGPPEDGQECLVTAKALNNKFYIDIATFATDLYSVDKYSFRDRKGESGWYFTDLDLGELELPDVVAWQPLPDPYKGE